MSHLVQQDFLRITCGGWLLEGQLFFYVDVDFVSIIGENHIIMTACDLNKFILSNFEILSFIDFQKLLILIIIFSENIN